MEKKEKLYEGKAKIIYATDDPKLVVQYFKDDATAFNGEKKGTIKDKGVYNCAISSFIFQHLEEQGIKTHFVERLNDREMLVKKVEIIPIEVVMRNYIAGSLVKRLGFEEGIKLNHPIVEYYYKNDDLGDPMINDYHIKFLRLATERQLSEIKMLSFQIDTIIKMLFSPINLNLVDFKLEFGFPYNDGLPFTQILLADEISGDTCRLWDTKTNEKLDKDRFRFDLGDVENAYHEIYSRLIKYEKNNYYIGS